MINFYSSLLLLMCIVFSNANALTPPKPIEGAAFIAAKEFSTDAGDFTFNFKFPSGWGMGNMSTTEDGSGIFMLFPLKGGAGCSIEISKYSNGTLLKAAFDGLLKEFSSAKLLDDGFEVEFSKAWYAWTRSGEHMIQIWYSIPKKTKEYAQQWKGLKDCVSIGNKASKGGNDVQQQIASVTEYPLHGWWCHHPNNKLHILFESFPSIICAPAKDSAARHLLSFTDFTCSGFFYVKWDQEDFDKIETFQKHLDEMVQDLKKMESKQTVDTPTFDLNQKYAILPGSPYSFVTLASPTGHFLFGFAIKRSNSFLKYDINDLIKRVKYAKDK